MANAAPPFFVVSCAIRRDAGHRVNDLDGSLPLWGNARMLLAKLSAQRLPDPRDRQILPSIENRTEVLTARCDRCILRNEAGIMHVNSGIDYGSRELFPRIRFFTY